MRSAILLLALISAGASAQTGVATNYAVTTAGDTLRTAVEFKDPLLGQSYVSVDGVRREISEFEFLFLDGVTNAVVDGRRLAPLLTDGRVRFYARTESSARGMIPGPDGQPMMTSGPNGQLMMNGSLSNTIGYIQTPGGPVLKATNSALRSALGDNAESVRHLNRARTLRTAGWVAVGLGIATALAGTALSLNDADAGTSSSPRYLPMMIGGAVVAAGGSYILPGMADTARDQAIDAYNAE